MCVFACVSVAGASRPPPCCDSKCWHIVGVFFYSGSWAHTFKRGGACCRLSRAVRISIIPCFIRLLCNACRVFLFAPFVFRLSFFCRNQVLRVPAEAPRITTYLFELPHRCALQCTSTVARELCMHSASWPRFSEGFRGVPSAGEWGDVACLLCVCCRSCCTSLRVGVTRFRQKRTCLVPRYPCGRRGGKRKIPPW